MEVDLTNCDREEIHLLGHVQSFGCLIALSSDWLIMHASQSAERYLGLKANDLIGLPLHQILTAKALHEVRGAMQLLATRDSIGRLFDLPLLPGSDRLFNLALHRTGRATVIEIEPADEQGQRVDPLMQVHNIVGRLKTCPDVETLSETAARFLRAFLGFDRVMVYRFASDDTGAVIAESAAHGIGSFLGLRYPASDIPRQARALYLRSVIRIISDVDDKVSPILPEVNAENEKLDLSLSTLRAVSPIHLEYLRNMGVKASMSISIIVDGKLWGLFACHHYQPLVLDYVTRSAAELFGQMFGFLLSHQLEVVRKQDAERARDLHDDLMRHFAESSSISGDLGQIIDGLKDLVAFDGAAGWIAGTLQTRGTTPTHDEIMALVRFLNTTTPSQVYATDCLMQVHPPAADYTQRAAGVLAMPVSRTPRDYIMLFRGEVAKQVTWAGNPEKPVEVGPNGIRLTPRKSFESWQEIVRGHSAEWTPQELEVADTIRVTLLEVVLRMADSANQERQRASERQELLIAELNHRVRNILTLIRGLVEQSKSDLIGIEEFTANVSDRIQALARAHDQITRSNWNAASLRELVETEVTAYLGAKRDRVVLHGGDAIVKPEAYATLALVIHELTTNSAKYGSLADSRGRVDVTVKQEADGVLGIGWVESDGPPVKAPARRGFGSTVIERSIPFELGGKVEVSYPLTGLRAQMHVPARHIERFEVQAEDEPEVSASADEVKEAPLFAASSPTVLLLEDNMIIAMDGERYLADLGAERVVTASSVAQAMAMLDAEPVVCGLLDLNLGVETSLPVARRLREQGVPFAFATGYGDAGELAEEFPDAPVLTKPYDLDQLADILRQILPDTDTDTGGA
ncbi:GAF domain-containing protein [Aurantiacibacter xanthus]|uniref:histidine kinase n=1 Tax=Aurantiacibacter xanthus TaxID=1784712 RepID=A0A3A1P7N4_9SPHN|nr:HWE histidine kinase domain-containing protein [Aurantiacibacter xanthus]RIV86104.1 GAF domain-containing protein [Aurantiacibacter xanthus]